MLFRSELRDCSRQKKKRRIRRNRKRKPKDPIRGRRSLRGLRRIRLYPNHPARTRRAGKKAFLAKYMQKAKIMAALQKMAKIFLELGKT